MPFDFIHLPAYKIALHARLQSNRLVEIRQRSRIVLLLHPRCPARRQRSGECRPQHQRSIEIGERAIQLPRFKQRLAPEQIDHRLSIAFGEGFIEGRDGAPGLSRSQQGDPAAEKRPRIVGAKLQSPIEIHAGLARPPLEHEREASPRQRVGLSRIDGQCTVEIDERLVDLTLLDKDLAPARIGDSMIWIDRDRAIEVLQCALVLPRMAKIRARPA